MVGLFAIQLPQIVDVSRLPQFEDIEKINDLDTKKATPKSGKENQIPLIGTTSPPSTRMKNSTFSFFMFL